MTDWVATSHLLIMPSRLYMPNFQGHSRWVVLNTRSKRAYLAVGKEQIPPIIELLTNGFNDEGSVHSDWGDSAEVSQLLRSCDLFCRSKELNLTHTQGGILECYWHAAHDYPFLSHSSGNWREVDHHLMTRYARESPPPEVLTKRSGEFHELPQPNREFLIAGGDRTQSGQFSFLALSNILYMAFGKIGVIDGGEFGPWLRKTSPSGGARHPTECYLRLRDQDFGLPAGKYAYMVEPHALVRVEDIGERTNEIESGSFELEITSRVERVMWRYRDIRAFRPLVLDAGHVMETLLWLLEEYNFVTAVSSPSSLSATDTSWLQNLPLVRLQIKAKTSFGSNRKHISEGNSVSSRHASGEKKGEAWLTNPFMALMFDYGKLVAYPVWPERRKIEVNLSEFELLSYCQLSLRGDRPTTFEHLAVVFPRISSERLRQLTRDHVLIESSTCRRLLVAASDWYKFGWYLSLLAYLDDFAASDAREPVIISHPSLPNMSSDTLHQVLYSRRTTRSFTSEHVEKKVLKAIIADAFVGFQATTPNNVPRVYISPRRVEALPCALYRWNNQYGDLERVSAALSLERVAEIVAGQQWVADSSVVLWLVSVSEKESRTGYVRRLLDLGRFCQRLCILATKAGLGVFQSPAVSDTLALTSLQLGNLASSVVYAVALGREAPYK